MFNVNAPESSVTAPGNAPKYSKVPSDNVDKHNSSDVASDNTHKRKCINIPRDEDISDVASDVRKYSGTGSDNEGCDSTVSQYLEVEGTSVSSLSQPSSTSVRNHTIDDYDFRKDIQTSIDECLQTLKA